MHEFIIHYPVVSIITGFMLLTVIVLSDVAIMAPFWFSDKQMKAFTRCLAVSRVAAVTTALVFAIAFFAFTLNKLIQA